MMQIPPQLQRPSPEQLSLSLSLTEFSEKQKSTSWPLFQSDDGVHLQSNPVILSTEARNESSCSATRHLHVLGTRTQQQRTQLHNNEANHQPRKMARTKSPSQKIPRSNHNPIDMNKNEHPTIHNPSDQHLFETDENGNPKICFSYRTMQKQYEKDTLRMLERIQKSRSFELQQQQHEQQPPNNNHPSISQRSSSLTEFATANHETSQDYQLHYDSGFYIGDENDCNDHYHHDRVHDNQDWLEADEEEEEEEEEEIFELDL